MMRVLWQTFFVVPRLASLAGGRQKRSAIERLIIYVCGLYFFKNDSIISYLKKCGVTIENDGRCEFFERSS